MPERSIEYSDRRDLSREQVVTLYQAAAWSSAEKPDELLKGLLNSHTIMTAWDQERLVGIGNAISDGHLVVYYPHLLVHPEWRGRGIGTELMRLLMLNYAGFHQQMIVADEGAVEFYRKIGFAPAGNTKSMWIYSGRDH